jgi:hypothetical protein
MTWLKIILFLNNTLQKITSLKKYKLDLTELTLKTLTHGSLFDDTVTKSLHLSDDSTDYQNTSGKVAYAMVTITSDGDSGARSAKIYSAPTTDSKTAATEVWDSLNFTAATAWGPSELITSWLVPIQNNHYIVIENTSGATPRDIKVDIVNNTFFAFVIEQA